jgi:hypothetical protein
MDAEGKVGYAYQLEGSKGLIRLDRLMSLVTVNNRGFYAEPVSRGQVFSLILPAWTTTINAGNIVAAAAAATTQFALWNPVGSGKNLELLRFGVWPISGTAPVPPVTHSFWTTPPSIASVGTAYSNLIGPAAASVARWIASAAGTAATGSSALLTLRAADLYITAGTAANLQGGKCVEAIDGDIVLPPGTGWVPTWAAAGTTFLGGYSVTWMEVPIPS